MQLVCTDSKLRYWLMGLKFYANAQFHFKVLFCLSALSYPNKSINACQCCSDPYQFLYTSFIVSFNWPFGCIDIVTHVIWLSCHSLSLKHSMKCRAIAKEASHESCFVFPVEVDRSNLVSKSWAWFYKLSVTYWIWALCFTHCSHKWCMIAFFFICIHVFVAVSHPCEQ